MSRAHATAGVSQVQRGMKYLLRRIDRRRHPHGGPCQARGLSQMARQLASFRWPALSSAAVAGVRVLSPLKHAVRSNLSLTYRQEFSMSTCMTSRVFALVAVLITSFCRVRVRQTVRSQVHLIELNQGCRVPASPEETQHERATSLPYRCRRTCSIELDRVRHPGNTSRADSATADACRAFDSSRQAGITPDAALALLKEGNSRFVSGRSINCDLLAQAKATAASQAPFAAVVGCIDSRVPPSSSSTSTSATSLRRAWRATL